MSPARRLLIGAIVLVAGTLGYAGGRFLFRPSERVTQPIAFNHQRHVKKNGIECGTCHELYSTSRHAGLPTLATCLGCHEEAQTQEPEEQKIRALAAAGRNDVFRKLFRLAEHTRYSHRTHVAIAKLTCDRCHGAIAEATEPPRRPLVRITMDFCLGCHARMKVGSDCTRCHR